MAAVTPTAAGAIARPQIVMIEPPPQPKLQATNPLPPTELAEAMADTAAQAAKSSSLNLLV